MEPSSNAELYDMTKNLVEPINAKQVYLHCGTWPDQYWLRDRDMVYVNTKIFPNGKEDLKAYIQMQELYIRMNAGNETLIEQFKNNIEKAKALTEEELLLKENLF